MGINLERAALKSRQAEARNTLQKIEVKADALVSDIRAKLDPYAGSVTELKTSEALVLLEELDRLGREAQQLKNRLVEYQEALDG